jgi:hypothetical protein
MECKAVYCERYVLSSEGCDHAYHKHNTFNGRLKCQVSCVEQDAVIGSTSCSHSRCKAGRGMERTWELGKYRLCKDTGKKGTK